MTGTTIPLTEIYTDRSRIVADWKCPRARYWQYEHAGRGIVTSTTSLELWLGTAIHDALAAAARCQLAGGMVEVDIIAGEASRAVFNSLTAATVGELDAEAHAFACEQSALVEGLLRGFFRSQWPRLLDGKRIVSIEEEMTFRLPNGIIFMSKPDLIVEDLADGEWEYKEYKSTSSKKTGWVNSWATAVQLHSTVKAVGATKGREPSRVVVHGLYKGYECLAPSTPVLTADLRWVAVGDLKRGDKIAGFEEQPVKRPSGNRSSRRWQCAEVLAVGREKLPAYKLTMADGTSLVCSENHLWLTTGYSRGSGGASWTRTSDLKRTDRIIKAVQPWAPLQNRYDVGYLAAAFDSEGCLVQHKTKTQYWLTWLNFTQNDNVVLREVHRLLTDQQFEHTVRKHKSRSTHDIAIRTRGAGVLKFLGSVRPKRLLEKFSFDKLGGLTDDCCMPVRVAEIEYVGVREVVTLGTSTETLIAAGFASHNSYGRQNSPFCYAYVRDGQPPMRAESVRYDYAAGYRRQPVWERPGGVRAWVEGMPEDMLTDQFPQTPPIFVREHLVEAFFRQTAEREAAIAQAATRLRELSCEGAERERLLDTVFPQHFEQCSPSWGRGCGYKRLCHGVVGMNEEGLPDGFAWREPHHQPELDAQEVEG